MKTLLALLLFIIVISSVAWADTPADMGKSNITPSQLRVAMRMLWDEHVGYTRNYIISSIAGLGDAESIAQRLLKNQDDIGNAIKPFYGNDAGTKLSDLLIQHIVIAVDVVKYAKAGKKEELEKAQNKWKANADQIANFLSGANPAWSKSECMEMLNRHLSLTTDEVTYRLKKDWKNDIMSYDQGHEHMMMFADFLTNGIVKQFPDKFTKE